MAISHHLPADEIPRSAVAVLAVRDWLEQRPADAKALSFEDRQILKEGLDFVKLVMNGQATVLSSGASIVTGDESLAAYEDTSRALGLSRLSTADSSGKKDLLKVSQQVLARLLDGIAKEELDPGAVGQTTFFFRTMEDYYFTGQAARPESLFDQPEYLEE